MQEEAAQESVTLDAGEVSDPVDALLAEFDEQNGVEKTGEPDEHETTQARLERLESFQNQTLERDAAAFAHQSETSARECFTELVKLSEAELADDLAGLPRGYVSKFFNAELSVNPRLGALWDKVYSPDTPPTQADVESLQAELHSSFEAMKRDVAAAREAKLYDPDATANRMAVSAAVKGAATSIPESDGPSLAEYMRWPDDKKEDYARQVSRRYSGKR